MVKKACIAAVSVALMSCRTSDLYAVAATADHETRMLSSQAMAGDARSRLELADAFQAGPGVPQDTCRALRIYQKLSERGKVGQQIFIPGTGNAKSSIFQSASNNDEVAKSALVRMKLLSVSKIGC